MGVRVDELLAQAKLLAPLAARRGEDTVLLAKAQGCRVFDADNVAYIDLIGGGGANLLGYANQYILDAVRRAATLGLAFGFHPVTELELAEQLSEMLPQLAPWVITPSEVLAWELALRWCRRDTGRDGLVIFDGNRRGAVEAFHVNPGARGRASQPAITGLPPESARQVRVAPWGNTQALGELLDAVGDETAAVILDPIAGQFGVVPPDPAFLAAVAKQTRRVGARLVLDETVTGFRLGRGGAAEAFGVSPDVAVFGGALGGGVSHVGAVSWQRELAVTVGDELPPPPPPIALSAATATLSVLKNDAVHQRLEERGAQLQSGLEALAERTQTPLRCARVGSILSCCLAREPVVDSGSLARVDEAGWERFTRAVRDGGVLVPSRSPATLYLSHAHGVKDIEQVLAAMETALKRIQKEGEA
jgi:glutamate-1-semialdehyde 2,1-aminomutase